MRSCSYSCAGNSLNNKVVDSLREEKELSENQRKGGGTFTQWIDRGNQSEVRHTFGLWYEFHTSTRTLAA